MINPESVESFPALAEVPGLTHGFTLRAPEIEVRVERTAALARLDAVHAEARRSLGLAERVFVTATQIHGREVVVVDATQRAPVAEADGLITNDRSVCLGIHVADCCAVYLVDARRGVIGLLHSGKKGSELGITTAAVARMQAEFGCDPADIIAQLSPCIRPPCYEIDFAAQIVAQARTAGVSQVYDAGTCTSCHPHHYYSYRRELGRTGRMLALLALA